MEVKVIKANESQDGVVSRRKIERLRVAAYCRVSTDDEDQAKSYSSMVRYYTDYIKENKNWIFAGVYADEAATGTKDNREGFQSLIQDCMSGDIDLILTKSIARFARNTLDTIKYVRLLKEKNIAVYFEAEKINTLKDGEFLLTILGSVAQQEVVNTSANVKKGLKVKMVRGEIIGFNRCLGYDYNGQTKELTIKEDEAAIVRYIFDRYVSGAGSTVIAKELNEQGITTIHGNEWASASVIGVIKNEKYIGDLLQGKTFTQDPISKRRLKNYGEEDRFLIKNHHEAIISEEVYKKAQEIRNGRSTGLRKVEVGKREKFSRQYAFSCMLECAFCGDNLSRRSWHSGTKNQKTVWQCVTATKKGKVECPDSKGIWEKVIEDAFVESYKMLCRDNTDVLEEFICRVEKALKENSAKEMQVKLQKQLSALKGKRKKLLDNLLDGVVEKELYEESDLRFVEQIADIKNQLEQLEEKREDKESLEKRLKSFRRALQKNEILEEFDREIFESMIEKVVIGGYDDEGKKDPYRITFVYKTGFRNCIKNAKKKVAPENMQQQKECVTTEVSRSKNCVPPQKSTHTETIVSLSKGEINSKKVKVEISLEDMDLADLGNGATYSQIKEYVKEQTGLTVSSLNIAQVKQKCGIIERENYNKAKSENVKQPKCTQEKEQAIMDAFKHFGMV